jgi:hypothetical protein
MRKTLIALVVVPMLFLGAGCVPKSLPVPTPQPEPQSQVQELGAAVALKLGQTATFKDGLKVALDKINDSRCPSGVQCIWAGELSPVLTVSGAAFTAPVQVILGMVRTQEQTQSGYHFVLKSATESVIELLVEKTVALEQDARIHVTSPIANQTVTSPLKVTGEAKGSWYFEATFPVKLVNAAGVTIASTPARAQNEWMTDTFVPFIAELKFAPQPAGSTGKLVLMRDNPSGLPENDASISIPVRF